MVYFVVLNRYRTTKRFNGEL